MDLAIDEINYEKYLYPKMTHRQCAIDVFYRLEVMKIKQINAQGVCVHCAKLHTFLNKADWYGFCECGTALTPQNMIKVKRDYEKTWWIHQFAFNADYPFPESEPNSQTQ